MPTDSRRVQAVFLAAAKIHDLAERARLLDQACDGDPDLKSQVEALLHAYEQQADRHLDDRAVSSALPEDGPTQNFRMPGAASGAGERRTVSHESGEPADDDDEVPLAFLAPPSRAGSLGRIGHYEVLQVVGKGGFGIVFRAFDDVLQRVVALKVLAPALAATSPARKRFLREARSTAGVRHENVVQVYEIGEQPLPYLVMEFIPGETLQQRLDRVGPVEPAEVVRVGRQIAEGLAAAHATDLIHRDVKPANVLLEGVQQRVKLTDFGLARAADDASISQSGIIAGTPTYMAPEQARGETLDQRADLFSLGSVLYQMAAGRPPFRANGALAVLKRVAEDTPRPIREIIPETPQWLCDVIGKLHAKNPDDRFQSAREVADVLADCEARLRAKQEVTNVLPAAKSGGRRWWAAVAAILLLPVLAFAVTEFAGVTRLFRGQVAKPEPPADPKAAREQDPDRRGAEYVLSTDGWISCNNQDAELKDLPRESFRLTGAGIGRFEVSDAGLAHLKGCENLTVLNLNDAPQLSDAGLAHLKDLEKLTYLGLAGTRVSDAGLASFEKCKGLKILILHGTRVSDAGVAHIKNFSNLTNLTIQRTNVTPAGIEELKEALPNCRIRWDGGVIAPK